MACGLQCVIPKAASRPRFLRHHTLRTQARTPSTHHAEHHPELTDIQNRTVPSAPADICNQTCSAPFRRAPIPAAAAPQRFTCRAPNPPRSRTARHPHKCVNRPPYSCRKWAMLTESQNRIELPTRKTKAASTRLLLRMNAAQQPNPRGGQPPRAYSLTLNTASSMLSPPLMPSASRFGRCASSGNITMKSPSRISTRAPSPSAKNSMSCSGS